MVDWLAGLVGWAGWLAGAGWLVLVLVVLVGWLAGCWCWLAGWLAAGAGCWLAGYDKLISIRYKYITLDKANG